MTPGHYAWTVRFVATLQAKVDLYRRIGTGKEGEAVIVAVLQAIIDRDRAAIAAADAADRIRAVPAPAPGHAAATDARAAAMPSPDRDHPWMRPAFWQGGVWRPLDAPRADRMLASAAVCRRLGHAASADAYAALAVAAAGDPDAGPIVPPVAGPILVDDAAQARLACVPAFAAGQQADLFG